MKIVWLVKDEHTIWFDTKPMSEALGLQKMPSFIEVSLTDAQYKELVEVSERYFFFQRLLEEKASGQVA